MLFLVLVLLKLPERQALVPVLHTLSTPRMSWSCVTCTCTFFSLPCHDPKPRLHIHTSPACVERMCMLPSSITGMCFCSFVFCFCFCVDFLQCGLPGRILRCWPLCKYTHRGLLNPIPWQASLFFLFLWFGLVSFFKYNLFNFYFILLVDIDIYIYLYI